MAGKLVKIAQSKQRSNDIGVSNIDFGRFDQTL